MKTRTIISLWAWLATLPAGALAQQPAPPPVQPAPQVAPARGPQAPVASPAPAPAPYRVLGRAPMAAPTAAPAPRPPAAVRTQPPEPERPGGRHEATRLELSASLGPGVWWVGGDGTGSNAAVSLGVAGRLHHAVSRTTELGGVLRLQAGWNGEVRNDEHHDSDASLYVDLGASLRLNAGAEGGGFRFGIALGPSVQLANHNDVRVFGAAGDGSPTNQTSLGFFINPTFDFRFSESYFVGFGTTLRILPSDFNGNGDIDWFSWDAVLRVGGDYEL